MSAETSGADWSVRGDVWKAAGVMWELRRGMVDEGTKEW